MENRFEGLLFDLDGTLTAPGHIDFAGLRAAIGSAPGQDILKFIQDLSVNDPDLAREKEKVLEKFEGDALDRVAPAPGLIETLSFFQRQGIPMGVLTRNNRANLEKTLQRLKIADFFAATLSREDAKPKPHPDGILSLCQSLAVTPQNTLMVGDYIHDIAAGHRAGTWTAWISTHDRHRPPEGSDFHITHLEALIGLHQGNTATWETCHISKERGV